MFSAFVYFLLTHKGTENFPHDKIGIMALSPPISTETKLVALAAIANTTRRLYGSLFIC
jgi:hypothetical protein